MHEILKYPKNLFMPKYQKTTWDSSFRNRHITDLSLGTYWKPIAKVIRYALKKLGWQVRLRGRGMRASKYHNINNDIRVKDSVFLAVYARKIS